MQNAAYEATWKTYQDAWADVPPAERQELLNRSVAEACVFADPDTEQSGVAALTTHIEEFQKQFPGAGFVTHKFLTHHAQAVAEWTMFAKDGSKVLDGTSVARFGEDGRLTQFAGFWTL